MPPADSTDPNAQQNNGDPYGSQAFGPQPGSDPGGVPSTPPPDVPVPPAPGGDQPMPPAPDPGPAVPPPSDPVPPAPQPGGMPPAPGDDTPGGDQPPAPGV